MYNKILICPDSFKESIDSLTLSSKIAQFLNEYRPIVLPMADGGEGSLNVLKHHLMLEKKEISIKGAKGQYVKSFYYVDPNSQKVFFELASASGLECIPLSQRDPSQINTFGTGHQILHAIQSGYNDLNFFLGGSSSNDAGVGIAAALGVKFYSQGAQIHLPKGQDLISIDKIEACLLPKGVSINLIHDVANPFVGSNGAVHTFAKQKGADVQMCQQLESGMKNMVELFKQTFKVDIAEMKGAGAAGGIAGGLHAMFNSSLIDGFDFFSNLSNLEERIKEVDLIVTGEGRIDQQSISGKIVSRICTLAKNNSKKVFTISGEITLSNEEMVQLGIIDSIELKNFGNTKVVNQENTLLQLQACKETLLEKIKHII